LLLVHYYRIEGRARTVAAWAFGPRLVAAVAGTTLWTFADPSREGVAFRIYIAGLTVSYLAIVFAALAIRATAVHRYHRSVQPCGSPGQPARAAPGPIGRERAGTRAGRQRTRPSLMSFGRRAPGLAGPGHVP
jgi:hypothetical protein